MNEKAEFAVRVLKQYALENQIPARSTSDLSPMEQWLILRLLAVMPSLPLELLEWWEGFRPEGWDIIQHLHNPCINCPTEREQKLAFWISRLLLGNAT